MSLMLFSERRKRDSNPRTALDGYTLSRRASSATRASLQKCYFDKNNEVRLVYSQIFCKLQQISEITTKFIAKITNFS